ncbi:hypothetical protein E4U41_001270 [Claviceps citrina]|nr:hypothetical protein E4U41_001270 [Claviceps citrina]
MDSNTSYGPVEPTAEAVLQLKSSSHSLHELQKAGYIVHQLPAAELERKKRCGQCRKVLKKERRNRPHAKPRLPLAPVLGAASSDTTPSDTNGASRVQKSNVPASRDTTTREARGAAGSSEREAEAEKPQEEPAMICKFHPGRIANRTGELENNWRFHETPDVPLTTHVAAVVIDCEMGTASSGETELIRISVVDYFTGAVLLDKLVYPSVRMAHYNTRFSGVSRTAMEEARRKNNCILGRDAARRAVHTYVGPSTVVVGHGANGDLSCLRWIHRVIVDTLLIETARRQIELLSSTASKNSPLSADVRQRGSDAGDADEAEGVKGNKSHALPQNEGGLSLKALALKRLDRVIQVKGRGHDSLEDARATRDLLRWHMANPLDMGA